MPYKCNIRRSTSQRSKYRVTNWPQYNNALCNRGDITIWFTEEAIDQWAEQKENYSGKGRPRKYSDVAIQTAIMIRQIFSLTLRATQGFLRSLVRVLKLGISIPDHSLFSRRSDHLKLFKLTQQVKPGSLVIVDSTGLKVYGKDEWQQEKHRANPKRTWRKLHLAVDENRNIIATELTTNKVGDPSALPDLLSQLENDFETFIADGAYDGQPIYEFLELIQPEAKVIIPPPKNASINPMNNAQRNNHIDAIQKYGKAVWQGKVKYGRRNLSESTILRYKKLIGNTLKARLLPRQSAEAQISVRILNIMTKLGMPASVKVS